MKKKKRHRICQKKNKLKNVAFNRLNGQKNFGNVHKKKIGKKIYSTNVSWEKNNKKYLYVLRVRGRNIDKSKKQEEDIEG